MPRGATPKYRIRFVFNEKKTAQAAHYLLRRNGGNLYYMALIKLLYLADRRSLLEIGQPITGDRTVNMEYGPVLSQVLELIRLGESGRVADPVYHPWFDYVSTPNDYVVSETDRTGNEELSEYELGVLEAVFNEHGHKDRFVLADETHRLPEWVDPGRSMIPIEPEDILFGEGRSEEEVRDIANEAAAARLMDRLIGVPR